ncbi:MAG TPA: hypothetical protein DEA55_08455 [Rhodospirillaceae bacterium]|nr:hypothetical protein [Rhodospirillaceae bacterium]
MVLPLAGCDGYERVAYTGVPYNNERTAGTGVAYVRANMLPEKGPVIEAAKPENKEIVKPKAEAPPPPPPAAPLEETKDILDDVSDDKADEIFNDAQDK